MHVRVNRFSSTDEGTFGALYIGGRVLYTCERPWLNNEPYESCIPSGSYKCVRVDSPKYGNVFEVTNVPGRAHILFHAANTPWQLEGCIAVGMWFGIIEGHKAVIHSREALEVFHGELHGVDGFTLEI